MKFARDNFKIKWLKWWWALSVLFSFRFVYKQKNRNASIVWQNTSELIFCFIFDVSSNIFGLNRQISTVFEMSMWWWVDGQCCDDVSRDNLYGSTTHRQTPPQRIHVRGGLVAATHPKCYYKLSILEYFYGVFLYCYY